MGIQTLEIRKVRNSISYDSLDHVYLRAFLFSIRKKKKKNEKSEAKNLCVEVHWGGDGGGGA